MGGALKANKWTNLSFLAKSLWYGVVIKEPFLSGFQKNVPKLLDRSFFYEDNF